MVLVLVGSISCWAGEAWPPSAWPRACASWNRPLLLGAAPTISLGHLCAQMHTLAPPLLWETLGCGSVST
jgi:hypothetical protein